MGNQSKIHGCSVGTARSTLFVLAFIQKRSVLSVFTVQTGLTICQTCAVCCECCS